MNELVTSTPRTRCHGRLVYHARSRRTAVVVNSCTRMSPDASRAPVDFPLATLRRLSFDAVTEIPEHLLKRSKAAKAKAEGEEPAADAPAAPRPRPRPPPAPPPRQRPPKAPAAPAAPAARRRQARPPVRRRLQDAQEDPGLGDGHAQHPAGLGVHVRAALKPGHRSKATGPLGDGAKVVRRQLLELPRRRRRGRRLGRTRSPTVRC